MTILCHLLTMGQLPMVQAAVLQPLPSVSQTAAWSLPAELGEITETKFPKNYDSSMPLVVHVQDAHTAHAAQENISRVLNYLKKEKGFNLFLLEGGYGEVDSAKLKVFQKRSLNKKLWKKMMRHGEIGGAEMFILENEDAHVRGFGVESGVDYQKNLKAYREVLRHKEKWQKPLKLLGVHLKENLRLSSNKELLRFVNGWLKYTRLEDTDVASQFQWVAREAERYLGLSLEDSRNQVDWPQLVRYVHVQSLGRQIEVERAREEFIELKQKFTAPGVVLDMFWQTFNPARESGKKRARDRPSARTLLETFDFAARPMGFRYRNYPALKHWFAREVLQEELDPVFLFQEWESMVNLILDHLAHRPREKEAVESFKEWHLLTRFLNLEVTRSEAQLVLAQSSLYRPSAILRSLGSEIAVKPMDELDQAFEQAGVFYQLAQRREGPLSENTQLRMKEKEAFQAVLITGGFHTEGLRDLFLKQGFGWISIRPRIRSIHSDSHYERVMRGDFPAEVQSLKSPLYLTGESQDGLQSQRQFAGPRMHSSGLRTAIRHDLVLAMTAARVMRGAADLKQRGPLVARLKGQDSLELRTALLEQVGLSVTVEGFERKSRRIGMTRAEVRVEAADLDQVTQAYFESKVQLEKAARVIYSEEYYPLLSAYWGSKKTLDELPAPMQRAFVEYQTAFQGMKKASAQAARLKPAPADRERSFAELKSKKIIPEDLMVESSEMVRAAVETWGPEHQRLVDQNAYRMAGLLARGSDAVSLAKDLIRRSGPMRLEDFLPPDIAREPQSREMFFDRLKKFGRAEKYRMWAQTTMSPGDLSRETKILVQPLERLSAFRVAHLHELFHDLAHSGRLPIVPDHELITHAVTAAELVRDGGLEELRYFGDEVHVRLYEHGRSLYGGDKPVNDLNWLLEETRKVYLAIVSQEKPQREAVDAEAQEGGGIEPPPVLTPEMRRRQYFDFERLAGSMLGGYGAEREAKENEDSLVYFTQYATDVLSRHDSAIAAMMQSEEGHQTAARLKTLLTDLARTITRDRGLQFETLKEDDQRQELPEVRYLPAEHKIVAPESLWYLHEEVARGLVAQEIARALHAQPDLISPELRGDSAFMELWYSMDAFRVVQAAYKENPGLMSSVSRYYDYRHTVINLESARRQMNQLPAHLQYLAGLVWEWQRHLPDPRISRPEVLKAMEQTRPALAILCVVDDPGMYLDKLQEDLWPVMAALREQAVRDGMLTEVMQDMAQLQELALTETQQSWDQSGQLQLEDMEEDQREEVEQKLDKTLPVEDRQRLEAEIRRRLEEMTRLYREKQGGQALGDMRIKMAQQSAASKAGFSPHAFPMAPSKSPSGLQTPQKKSMTLAEALKALIKEAEVLEKLAERAQQTADQLAQNADGTADAQEPLDLVKSLNEQAKALSDEARRLRENAQQFERAVQEARRGVPADAERVKSDAQSLAENAQSFVGQTESFENGAESFARLGEALETRVEQDASALTPELAGAVSTNAKKLQTDSHSLHEHAGRIQQLTDGLARAFQQMAGQARPGQGGEGSSQPGGRPQEAPLKDVTHEHLGEEEAATNQSQQAGDSNRAGGRGYGSGRSTYAGETKRQPKPPALQRPAGFKPPQIEKPSDPSGEDAGTRKAAAPEADKQRALETLRQLMLTGRLSSQSARQRRRLSQLQNSAVERKQFYQSILSKHAAAITRIRSEIMAAFQKTEMGGIMTGLVEGDFLDPNLLGHIRDRPPAVMAVDIAPEEYDVYISLLTDLSGSMLSPLLSFLSAPPSGITVGTRAYDIWLGELYANSEQGLDLEHTYLYQAALAAAIFREATQTPGVKSEEYGFHTNAAIHFRDYDEKLTRADAERINYELFSHAGNGTNDTEAIARAVNRMAVQRLGRPGLRIIGIGLGSGTEKVRDAYYPNGYYVEDVADLPKIIKQIVREQLTGTHRVPNVIIVLTDGNPGANNNAFIQGLMEANQKKWDKRFTLRPSGKRSEVRAKVPFEYVWDEQGGQRREYLVIQGHKLATGKGGPLAPRIEIIPTSELNLPAAPGDEAGFPADAIARLELAEGAKTRSFLVPLSAYNMKLLAQMMEVLASVNKPNLYLRGPAAGGKNTLIYLLAALAKRPIHLMSLNHGTTEHQLIASQAYGEGGKDETSLRPSALVQAAMDPDGAWGALDEVNKPANPGVLSSTYSLAEQRFITMPDSTVVLAPQDFRMIALGNPNRPPYVVSEMPVDFDRRFQFVDVPYLHSPQQKKETDEQMKERLADLAFLLRLQAPTLYAREQFYTYRSGGTHTVSGKHFIDQLILLAQDMVVAFEDGALPRPMSVRGLMRIARHFEYFPEDIADFQEVFGGAYNLRRLSGDPEQSRKLDAFLDNRLPGLSTSVGWTGHTIPFDVTQKKLASAVVEKKEGDVPQKFYQIFEVVEGSTTAYRVLVEYPLPAMGKKNLPVGKLPELQSVLRKKLALIKSLLLGENVLIYAHSGTGKTSLVLDLLVNDLLAEPYQMQMNANSTVAALYGHQAVKDGRTVWMQTPLLLALRHNRPLLIDDIGKPRHQAVISVLNNALQFGQITTPYGIVSGDAPVIATTTPEEVRYGGHPLSGEVEDRFRLHYFDWMSPTEEKEELEGLFPNLSGPLISRLVEAVGLLRQKEEMQSEFMRPVTLQDMIVTLERFQRSDRELLDIFMSVYGIEPVSDYAASIEATFAETRFNNPTTQTSLAEERYSDFAPTPKPQEILRAVGEDAKMHLLRRLITSFQGHGKKHNFRVQLNSARPFGIATAGKNAENNDIYEIQVPQAMGTVGLTYQLKNARHLSATEQKVMERLYEGLSQRPIVELGDATLLAILKLALSKPDDDVISLTNLQALARYLTAHEKKSVDREPLRKALEWIVNFELYSFPVKELARKILAAFAQQDVPAALRELSQGLSGDPAILRAIDSRYFERVKAAAKDLYPGFDTLFDGVTGGFYAAQSIRDRAASIGVYENEALIFFDHSLSGKISEEQRESLTLMHALLFSREAIRWALRRSSTAGYNLNEELALMAEVDRVGWSNLKPPQRRSLAQFAGSISLVENHSQHLGQFFLRLQKYAEQEDHLKTWNEEAEELAAMSAYKDEHLNSQHVGTYRANIRSLAAQKRGAVPQAKAQVGAVDSDPAAFDMTEFVTQVIGDSEEVEPGPPILLQSAVEELLAAGQLPIHPVELARQVILLNDRIQNANYVSAQSVSQSARLIALGTDYRTISSEKVRRAGAGIDLGGDRETEFPVIYLWDTRKKEVLKVIEGFTTKIVSLTFDETGTYLAALDKTGNVFVWGVDELNGLDLAHARRASPHPGLNVKKLGFVNASDLPEEADEASGFIPSVKAMFAGAARLVSAPGPYLAGFNEANQRVWHEDVGKMTRPVRSEVRQGVVRAADRFVRRQLVGTLDHLTPLAPSVLRVSRWGTEGLVGLEWKGRLGRETYEHFVRWSSGRSLPLWALAASQTSTARMEALNRAALTPVSVRIAAAAPFGLSVVRAGRDYTESDFMTTVLLLSLPQNQYKLQVIITAGLTDDQTRDWKFFSDRYLDGRLVFIREEAAGFIQTVEHFFSGSFEQDRAVTGFLSAARRLARQSHITKTLTLDDLRGYTSVMGDRSEILQFPKPMVRSVALRLFKEGETLSLRGSASYRLDALMSLKTAGLKAITADSLDAETLRSLETLESGIDGSLVRVSATPGLLQVLSFLAQSAASISQAA